MDKQTGSRIAAGFVAGAFEALEALLGAKFAHKTAAPGPVDSDSLNAWCSACPVCVMGAVSGGGRVAILWPMNEAAGLVARIAGEDPATKVSVAPSDQAMLQDLAETLLHGGAPALGELLGTDAGIENAAATIGGDAAALRKHLGGQPAGAEISFQSESGNAKALFAYSDELERRVAGGPSATEEPLVSQEEVKDILKDFSPEDESDDSAGGNGAPLPENLEVVLDIELVATARLGRVEVPLADVLNYGPGSIIELGHMVDEPVELLVNGKLIARGDVVVVDEKFGLRITEIVSPRERIESLR
jgi:flagellar motor switch protein FliN